jgi:hypothetical protein
MKAKLIKPDQSNAYNYGRDKELVSAYSVVGTINGELREIVTARAYMGRSNSASVVYMSLWVHGAIHASGKGSAGGYGYHKESQALADAIQSAGIELYGSQYADEKGMEWRDYPNQEWSQEARGAAYAESEEAGKRYDWRVSKYARKLVKEDLKKRAHIGGCGSDSMRQALLAIAKLAGAKGRLCFISH